MELYVLIVAGGSGQRMRSVVPKQFLELEGKPVLMHTILKFTEFSPSIKTVVVLPENHIPTWLSLIEYHQFSIDHKIVKGGEVRFQSVKNGLQEINQDSIVAIHDGVRPLVSVDTIKRCFIEAEKYGNAVPCIPVYETIRKVHDNSTSTLEDRTKFRLIQTPQVFHSSLIKKAYEQDYRQEFTDDASVLEYMGEQIRLVEGNRENIKITDPLDLVTASALMKL